MGKDNGGESPQVREVGDAPNITRLIDINSCKECYEYMRKDPDRRKQFRSSWSSPEAFAAHIQDMDGSSWYDSNVWKNCDKSFSGVDNLQEAIDMAFQGWAEGGVICEKTRGYIQALNPISPKLVKYGIAGTTPNVPRAIAGNLLNMRMPDKKASTKKKTITIIYNMCECGWTNKDMIQNKAAVTAVLIDEIEAKGFGCEVVAVATTSNERMRTLTSVCVKESHQPVDINRLAFSLGHPGMFRALFFADWQGDDFCSDLGYGLGYVSTTTATADDNAEQIYTIEGGHSGNIKIGNFKDIDTAATTGLDKIVWALKKQGCPAFPALKEHEDDLAEDEEDHSSGYRSY
jgi:hypothetical protein